MTTWVFGYGSLVDRASLGATLGRDVEIGRGWAEARVTGFGRRWNYGVAHMAGRWIDPAGGERLLTIVALGVVTSPCEAVDGIVVAVDDVEIGRLDRRERHYDRVDVTASVTCDHGGGPVDGDVVVTYVPRSEAVERYRRARDRGSAAIEARYWDLVERAFAALGPDRLESYLASTPRPDVPIRPLERVPLA